MEGTLISTQKYEPLYNKVGLVDADIIAHRSASIAEPQHYCVTTGGADGCTGLEFDNAEEAKKVHEAASGSLLWTRREDRGLDFALQIVEHTLDAIVENAKPASLKLFLSGRDNFRYAVAKTTPYKGSREFTQKPKYLRKIREHLINAFGAELTDGYEADDAIGIASTELGARSFIATIDKDMDQLPGWHYDWVKDRVYRVSRKDADFNLYAQVLSGDSTDDVPGLPGIGPVKARKLLEGATSSADLLRRVWDKYRTSGSGSDTERDRWDYFIEQLRLVYVLRQPEDLLEVDLGFDEVFGKTRPGISECNEENISQPETLSPEQSLMLPNGWDNDEYASSMKL